MTKQLPLLILFLSLSFNGYTQRSDRPWHNHVNYKAETIDAIRQSPQLLNPELYFDVEPSNSHVPSSDILTDNIDFVNGINIAWLSFGRDIGQDPEYGTEYRLDMSRLNEIMDAVYLAGGNVIRWWYHTNGSTNPMFDQNQMVTPNPEFFHEEVLNLLDLAASKGLKIQICLWSFDMLKDQWNVDAIANKKLLTETDYYDAYINNALLPLVNEIGNHPGLYAWELFNEPEGMTTEYGNHWPGFMERVSITDVQSFINRTSAIIREAQPEVKITSGALGFLTSVNDEEKGYINLYSDERLEAEGNTPGGFLDFYNVHYYNWAGENGSPFHNNYDPERIDKEAIIAEYYPDYTYGIDIEKMGVTLMEKGWHGSLLWSWTDRPWDIMETIIYNAANHTLSVSDNDRFEGLKYYPNPTKNSINISGLAKNNIVKIELIDALGTTLIKYNVEKNTNFKSFPIHYLNSGTYFLKFNDRFTTKLIKQ